MHCSCNLATFAGDVIFETEKSELFFYTMVISNIILNYCVFAKKNYTAILFFISIIIFYIDGHVNYINLNRTKYTILL